MYGVNKQISTLYIVLSIQVCNWLGKKPSETLTVVLNKKLAN